MITDINNIDNTIVVDYLGCTVVYPEELIGTEREDETSYEYIFVMEHVEMAARNDILPNDCTVTIKKCSSTYVTRRR